ncbi:MAG: AAA family ATPase [bacterium]
MNRKLPIGISSFEEIRTSNYYYVDKTHFIRKLVDQGKYYFLSRPRRFGKSLFLDTIKCAFETKKELFQNLFLEKNWDWNISFPVIRIDFSKRVFDSNDLINKILQNLDFYFQLFQLPKPNHYNDYQFAFEQLIIQIYNKYSKQVVLLVDEYDKPILDNIENPQLALHIRETLKAFYQTIKPLDKYLKFVFITGISKFAKVSLFSGLNQLNDISLDKEYSTICGYTQDELTNTFGHLIDNKELELIKQWYNGYSWLGENVYNPFDVLLYLQKRDFRNYWFETGTPSFLIKVLQQKQFYIPKLEKTYSTEQLLSLFDIETIVPEALLFQSGYLTIKQAIKFEDITEFELSYPNKEVKIALNTLIANHFYHDSHTLVKNLKMIFHNLQIDQLPTFLNTLFAQVPFQWYTHMSQYEAFYCTVFYVFLVSTGLNVIAEDTSSTGSIDLTILHQNTAYVFEFKVDKGQPIEQILSKQYFNKYLHYQKVYVIGIVVDSSSRGVKFFQIKQIK